MAHLVVDAPGLKCDSISNVTTILVKRKTGTSVLQAISEAFSYYVTLGAVNQVARRYCMYPRAFHLAALCWRLNVHQASPHELYVP